MMCLYLFVVVAYLVIDFQTLVRHFTNVLLKIKLVLVWHEDDGGASGLFHLLMETGKAFKGNGEVSGFIGREVSRRQILNHHNINTTPFS